MQAALGHIQNSIKEKEMKSFSAVAFLALVSMLSLAANSPCLAEEAPASGESCELPGDDLLWAYRKCFYEFETDDEAHPGVSACMQDIFELIDRVGSCSVKKNIKQYFCAQEEGGSEAVDRCLQDPKRTFFIEPNSL